MVKIKEGAVFKRPASLKENRFHFCPGCHHGIVHRMVTQALDHFNIAGRTIAVIGVGCGVFVYDYMAVDSLEAPHGRAPAVATGLKRANPELIVFTYQGDGDLAAIGMAEILHAANRGENITVFFINNSVYGMTGGQIAPTTMVGQKTTTTPCGREAKGDGYPFRMAELLATLPGVYYSTRVACNTPANIKKAKKAVVKAFENQLENRGFSFVEFLSACPTNWHLTPGESVEKITKEGLKVFPLGVFKEGGDELCPMR